MSCMVIEMENHYQQLFNISPNVLLLIRSRDNVLVDANSSLTRILGWTKEDVVGNDCFDPKIWLQASAIKFQKAQKEGAIPDNEVFELLTKTKQSRMFRIQKAETQCNEEPCWFLICTDVTKLYQIQQQLKDREAKFRAVFDHAPFTQTIVSIKRHVALDVNQEYLKIYQTTREEVIGKSSLNLSHLAEPEIAKVMAHQLEEKGRIEGLQYQIHPRLGNRYYEAYVYPVRTTEEDVYVTISVDVTAKVEAEKRLKEWNATLEKTIEERSEELRVSLEQLAQTEKMSALGHLSAGIAHELNTPLGAILSSCKMIKTLLEDSMQRRPNAMKGISDDEAPIFQSIMMCGLKNMDRNEPVPRKQRKEIETILFQKGVENAGQIAEDIAELHIVYDPELLKMILDDPSRLHLVQRAVPYISILKMNAIALQATDRATQVVAALYSYLQPHNSNAAATYNLRESIQTLLALLHNKIKHGYKVNLRIAEDVLLVGSRDRLDQVWMNLIQNAMHAMERGGEIEIEAKVVSDRVVVSVVDSGPEVPMSVQGRMFDAFFTTKPKGEGLGLGLFLSRQIVHDHGGEISYERKDEKSIFTVVLPRKNDK